MISRNRISGLAVTAALTLSVLSALGAQEPTAPRKRGLEISGLPALNFDADEGFGYGAILALYAYGAGAVPYRYTVQPTVFLTTEGRRDLTIYFDAPALLPNEWRLIAFAGREQQIAAPYYGVGNDAPYDPAREEGGTRYYYRFGRERLRASADLQHTLGHPAARVLFGAGASREVIDLTPFDSGTTLIETELAGRSPATGHINHLRAGLAWDTRDREIGPHSGLWADIIAQRVTHALGASHDYTRVTATVRRYQPLGSRLTLANRVLVQNVTGDAPFYELATLQTQLKSQDGLGGASSVRGIPKDRYIGKGLLLTNSELRWRAAEFSLRGRPSALIVSSFVDAGRVWDKGVDVSTALADLHAGYGGGIRLSYGSSFIIAADVGHSSHAAAPVYIGLGYLF